MKNRLWLVLFLVLIWCGFSNNFGLLNIVIGLFFAIIIHFLVMPQAMTVKINIFSLLVLCGYMILELVRSSLEVAWDIITPTSKSNPQMIELPLTCQNATQISVLANLISLTPGTLAVDVEEEKRIMIVHVMFMQNKDKILHLIKDTLEPMIMRAIEHE